MFNSVVDATDYKGKEDLFKVHSQKEIEPIEGWPAFTYHIAPTYDFKQELLSHGAFV